ncbi:unnamed protein product [Phytomonas sp. EM1]|nr:unnamed protein product [Phytomonas sp. EM1]|eukprot:CCW59971.1 unnamed protein product [Phytomonas sp. isolate EM1]
MGDRIHGLRLNIADIVYDDKRDCEEALCDEGVRLGSLLVSSQGLRASAGVSSVMNGGASFPRQALSLRDLAVIPDDKGGFLGRGSSGTVYRAINRRTGAVLALKEIKVNREEHLGEIRRELEALYTSNHESCSQLVDFYNAFSHEGSVFIAMECLDGSLGQIRKPVPDAVLVHITRSVLQGLSYLHRTRHLIHRDLKPSNVLFSRSTGAIKISDFGLSSNLECTRGDANSFVGTVTYMSPERLKGEPYSYGADIWSLGLVVAELALGKCPYARLHCGSIEACFWTLLQHLSSDEPAFELPPEMDPSLADFIISCVAKAPEKRPTCAELLQHPFISSHCTSCDGDLDEEDRRVIREWLNMPFKKSRSVKARTTSDSAVDRNCCLYYGSSHSSHGEQSNVINARSMPRSNTKIKTAASPKHDEAQHYDLQLPTLRLRSSTSQEESTETYTLVTSRTADGDHTINLDEELNRLLL